MAKVIGPLLSLGARGRVAKTINYQRWKGRAYAKEHVDGSDPRTPGQLSARATFFTADRLWTPAPLLFQDPWTIFAQGQVKSGYNAWVGLFVRQNNGQTDLTRTVLSPGARGGLSAQRIVISSAPNQITVDFTTPTVPAGWTLESAVAAAMRDGDPATTTFYTITAGQDEVAQSQVVLTGLPNNTAFVVGGWLRWRKPSGIVAYGQALTGVISTPVGYDANAVHFDGINDWLTRGGGLTGAVDGENVLNSMWFRVDDPANDGVEVGLQFNSNITVVAAKNINDNLQFVLLDVAAPRYVAIGDPVFNSGTNTGWHHLIWSAELDASPIVQLYLDDAPLPVTISVPPQAGNIDFTVPDWSVAANAAGGFKLTGDLSDLYLHHEFLDLSVTANRRKFINASGKPVDLGADGSTPTGSIPLIFFSGATVGWHTNKGDGGGFTENGALTTAATSPSNL